MPPPEQHRYDGLRPLPVDRRLKEQRGLPQQSTDWTDRVGTRGAWQVACPAKTVFAQACIASDDCNVVVVDDIQYVFRALNSGASRVVITTDSICHRHDQLLNEDHSTATTS